MAYTVFVGAPPSLQSISLPTSARLTTSSTTSKAPPLERYSQALNAESQTPTTLHFPAQESKIGAKVGTPLDSKPYTSFSVTF